MIRPMIVLDWLGKEEGVSLEKLIQNIEYRFVPLDTEHPHWKVMNKVVSKGK